MKASVFNQFGNAEVLTTQEVAEPQLNATLVLVQVIGVAVNHVDTFVRSGRFKTALASPHIVGRDLVGTVVAVGNAVTDFVIGQRVWSNAMGYDGRMGATAEFVAVPANLLFPAPANVDPLQLVAALHPSATAVVVLDSVMKPTAGQTLLVEGAGGHVGTKFVAYGHQLKLRVLTTSHPRNFEALKQLGSSATFDYATPVTEAINEPIHHVVDTSGRVNLNDNLTLLDQNGEVTLITSPASGTATFNVPAFYMTLKHINGFVISHATPKQLAHAAQRLNQQFAAGHLLDDTLLIKHFDDAAWAHHALETGEDQHQRIVLVP